MLGIIGLDTHFTKPPGHIRNPDTFAFPTIQAAVEGATTRRMVQMADRDLLAPFTKAAQDLEARGATAITGGCGYMALFQSQVAHAVSVPVFLSSLMQLPSVASMLPPDSSVGVIVADERNFTRDYLEAVGAGHVDVRVDGMSQQPEFAAVMLRQERTDLDLDALERETVSVARRLLANNPDMGALVLECTDLAPFASAIQAAIGRPVFDVTTWANLVHRATHREPFA